MSASSDLDAARACNATSRPHVLFAPVTEGQMEPKPRFVQERDPPFCGTACTLRRDWYLPLITAVSSERNGRASCLDYVLRMASSISVPSILLPSSTFCIQPRFRHPPALLPSKTIPTIHTALSSLYASRAHRYHPPCRHEGLRRQRLANCTVCQCAGDST